MPSRASTELCCPLHGFVGNNLSARVELVLEGVLERGRIVNAVLTIGPIHVHACLRTLEERFGDVSSFLERLALRTTRFASPMARAPFAPTPRPVRFMFMSLPSPITA